MTVALTLVATGAAACKSSGSGSTNNPTTGGSATGGGGNTGKTLTISTDLPLQGSSRDTSVSTNRLIQVYLDMINSKAGNYTVKLQTYDDSTAAAGKWDPATCSKNANAHVANTNEVAVMGTYNSGCAKIEVPVLNRAPMLMVSHANTSPGLTKTYSGNDPGEPDKYYPTGKRNYARVVPADDFQGPAAARFVAETLKLKRCFVLDDNETYGKGVASAFVSAAKKLGISIVGNESWDSKQPNYTALFNKVKAQNPDCVYFGGIYDNNGGQLVKDKVNVLGDNTKVALIAPDGFTGYPALDALPQSVGMYCTFPAAQDTAVLATKGGLPAKLINAYKAKYGALPVGSYPVYGVAAVQVILAAIAKSDGTRQGIINQVFSGSGITIPAAESVTGDEIVISTKTGDPQASTYSVLVEKGGSQVFKEAVTA